MSKKKRKSHHLGKAAAKASVVVAAAALPALASTGTARAGDGSPGNPWRQIHMWYDKPAAAGSGWVYATEEHIQPTAEGTGGNYWAADFKQQNDGWYYGLQTNGHLAGTQTGPNQKVAIFSVFADNHGFFYDSMSLTPSVCDSGADGGGGVSCTIPYPWSTGISYQLVMMDRLSTSPTECPPESPYGCYVYSGYVRPTNTGSYKNIASWSVSAGVNGNIEMMDQFLEHFSGSNCGAARGRYSIPRLLTNAWNDYVLSPSNPVHYNSCGSTWKDGATSVIKLGTP